MMFQYINKIIGIGLMLLLSISSFAQQKKEAAVYINDTFKKTAFSLKENVHPYQYKVLETGVYEVSVISPTGELLSKPVKSKNFEQGATINFEINSKYWKAGIYKILIEQQAGEKTVFRLKIAPNKPYDKR